MQNVTNRLRQSRISSLKFLLPFALSITVAVTPLPRAQTAGAAIPKWDVASIKPCGANSNGAPAPGARGGGNGAPPASFSPTRMTLNCEQVIRLIRAAYIFFSNAQRPVSVPFAISTPIDGVPDWARTARYTIEANADANATSEMMQGPMLQALLEDRFKLKLHHETREVPVYDLVVAKGGPKLTPFVEGSCVPFETPVIFTEPPTLPEGQRYCRRGGGGGGANHPNLVFDDDGTTLDLFCKDFLNSVGEDGRRVVDKTGLTGKYTIHLEYAPTDAMRGNMALKGASPSEPTAPEIFTALQEQLGLKLVPDKGPGDFLVIDYIEPPTPN